VVKAGGMDDVLLGIVLERLGKPPLADEATDLLLAAFESEESLSAQLSGEAGARPSADCSTNSSSSASLSSVTGKRSGRFKGPWK
jgi:hypothetical protein